MPCIGKGPCPLSWPSAVGHGDWEMGDGGEQSAPRRIGPRAQPRPPEQGSLRAPLYHRERAVGTLACQPRVSAHGPLFMRKRRILKSFFPPFPAILLSARRPPSQSGRGGLDQAHILGKCPGNVYSLFQNECFLRNTTAERRAGSERKPRVETMCNARRPSPARPTAHFPLVRLLSPEAGPWPGSPRNAPRSHALGMSTEEPLHAARPAFPAPHSLALLSCPDRDSSR